MCSHTQNSALPERLAVIYTDLQSEIMTAKYNNIVCSQKIKLARKCIIINNCRIAVSCVVFAFFALRV